MKNYTKELEDLFIGFMIKDSELYVRCQNIINSEFFSGKNRDIVDMIIDYSDKYKVLPTVEQIKATHGVDVDLENVDVARHGEWFLDEFQSFAKYKSLEKAILTSAEDIEKGNYDLVEKRVKEASEVGLPKNLGVDYFENPEERLLFLKNSNGQNSTGWKTLDDKLFGGFNKGELNIFAGGSGSGKSLFLQNISLNWAMAGLNVVYVTFELSEELVGMRLDTMLTGTPSKDIFKNLEDVDLKVKMAGKKAGNLQITYMGSGSNANSLKAFLKEYEIQTGIKADALVIDYMDLMLPNDRRVSPSDLFVKDKYVSEEMRSLAKDLNVLFVTASQLNRASVEEVEFDHSHISGGISKINTADNVMGIYTSGPMRERGQYQLQFMKTRSSSGVGTRINLKFDQSTLRITDFTDEELEQQESTSNQIYDSLTNLNKTSNVTRPMQSDPEDHDFIAKGASLKKLINNLK